MRNLTIGTGDSLLVRSGDYLSLGYETSFGLVLRQGDLLLLRDGDYLSLGGCYNSLFGLGKYNQPDYALEGYWKLQEPSGTVAIDSGPNNISGNISGVASVATGIGPNDWLPSSFLLDGSDDFVDLGNVNALNPGSGDFTVASFVKTTQTGSTFRIFQKRGTGSFGTQDGWQISRQVSSPNWSNTAIDGSAGSYRQLNTDANLNDVVDGSWHHIAMRWDNGSTTLNMFLDGLQESVVVTGTGSLGDISNTRNATIGCAFNDPSTQSQFLNGNVAGVAYFSRALSDGEMQELQSGPEPLYVSGVAINGNFYDNSQTLTIDEGTWDNQNNGTLTYNYQWYRADDGSGTNEVAIQGQTSKTYITSASDTSKYLRAFVKASNDGGSDPLEFTYTSSYLVSDNPNTPVKTSGTPSISGTLNVGEIVTLYPAIWNNPTGYGDLTFGYEIYSYATATGTDEILEKTGSFPSGNFEVLLSPILENRYLRLKVSGSNDLGFDQDEVYWSSYTSGIGSGTDPGYQSYNALFGRRKHFVDDQLEGHWLLQETNGTTAYDSSRNNITGILTGTTISTGTGPADWLSSAFNFDGADDRIYTPDGTFNANETQLTLFSRFVSDGGETANEGLIGKWMNVGDRAYLLYAQPDDTMRIIIKAEGGSEYGLTSSNTITRNGSTWHSAAGTFNSGNLNIYVDGVNRGSTSVAGTNLIDTSGQLDIGTHWDYSIPALFWDGKIADAGIFSRELSSTEVAEWDGGPEPFYVSGIAITGDFTSSNYIYVNEGTWDNVGNGTLSYNYSWYTADDTNGTNESQIAGETGSSYLIDVQDDNKYIRALVAASNDGGNDPLEDKYTPYYLITEGYPAVTVDPSISGNLTQGETVFLLGGEWDGGGDPSISYRYKLVSYVDTSGNDPVVEKIFYSTSTSGHKVLLNQPSLVNRYLQLQVYATNSSGDGLGTSPVYSGAVNSGTFTDYSDSYNYWMGFGRHTNHDSLLCYMPCQDTADELSTGYIKDEARDTLNTVGSAVSTRTNTTASSPYLPSGLDFSINSNSWLEIDPSSVAKISGMTDMAWTVFMWSNADSYGQNNLGRFIQTSVDGGSSFAYVNSIEDVNFESEGGTLAGVCFRGSNYHFGFGRDDATDVYRIYRDGVTHVGGTRANTSTLMNSFTIGNNTSVGPIRAFDGLMAGIALFNEFLDAPDVYEITQGPEPLNLTKPDISGNFKYGQTIDCYNSGTWDSQNNGNMSVQYQWYRAEDAAGTNKQAIMRFGTSQTFVPTAQEVGLYLSCEVSVSNDGGVDPYEKTFSDFYLVSGADYPSGITSPSISGNIVQGELITLNAGSWDGGGDSNITYTYTLRSYATSGGTDPILEKRIVHTGTSVQALINQSGLLGRNLRLQVFASNTSGENTALSPYTSGVGSGTIDTTGYLSYNYLYGKGRHINWDHLKINIPMDDPSGNINGGFVEEIARDRHVAVDGTIGARRTFVRCPWISGGLDFTGAAGAGKLRIEDSFASEISDFNTDLTICLWERSDSSDTTLYDFTTTSSSKSHILSKSSASRRYYVEEDTNNYLFASYSNGVDYLTTVTRQAIGGDSGTFRLYKWSESFKALEDTISHSQTYPFTGEITIGADHTATKYFDGTMAGFAVFNFLLGTTELSEVFEGPEPYNLITPTVTGSVQVSGTGFVNEGDWESQNNGSLSYNYQWYRADDAFGTNEVEISGETSRQYVIDAADQGKYVRSFLRASNEGGYDPLEDTYTPYYLVPGTGTKIFLLHYNKLRRA